MNENNEEIENDSCIDENGGYMENGTKKYQFKKILNHNN